MADVSKFIAAQNAYEVLTGRRAEGNDVIVAPKHRKLSATNDYEAINAEVHVLLQYKQKLETELQLVEMRIRQAKDIKSEKHHIDHREEAVTFTQRFHMSARYWDKADLMKWFQPERYEDDPHHDYLNKTLYGPHLRKNNQDLDPYLQFLSFSPQYREEKKKGFAIEKKLRLGLSKTIQVRVGMDQLDAVDHGPILHLPLQALWQYPSYQKRLRMQGFDFVLADSLLYENVFHRLYT